MLNFRHVSHPNCSWCDAKYLRATAFNSSFSRATELAPTVSGSSNVQGKGGTHCSLPSPDLLASPLLSHYKGYPHHQNVRIKQRACVGLP